jgi:4a-hydroxytetrahydrobiopterin dehydratase
MARPQALDEDQIANAVAGLDGWSVADGKLHKEYQFTDFVEAFAFMTAAALCAERKNHHPEWFNVYKTVRVDLMTHDAGGITELDIELAREMDGLAR